MYILYDISNNPQTSKKVVNTQPLFYNELGSNSRGLRHFLVFEIMLHAQCFFNTRKTATPILCLLLHRHWSKNLTIGTDLVRTVLTRIIILVPNNIFAIQEVYNN